MTTTTDRPARPAPDLDPRELREAFAAFPSGVVAVAALVEGVEVGIAASSFTSISLTPPLVAFSVANTSSTWPALRRADHVGLSVLASHQDRVCRQLAGPAADRFTGVEAHVTDRGAVLLTDAVAGFDCTVEREIEAGDHTMVLLRLHAVHHGSGRGADGDDRLGGSVSPLVFHRSGFDRLAAPSRRAG